MAIWCSPQVVMRSLQAGGYSLICYPNQLNFSLRIEVDASSYGSRTPRVMEGGSPPFRVRALRSADLAECFQSV